MQIPFLDLKGQYLKLKNEIGSAIDDVLSSGQYILGDQVEKLEKEIATYCQVKYAVAVASGTDALLISLKALDIKLGDEVLVPVFSYIATAAAVSRLGAVPVFVDIDPITYNINSTKIEKRITTKTKAIIPVHLFGQVAEMNKIKQLVAKYNLKFIEDACQAIGARYRGIKIGNFGDTAALSFFPSKNLGCYGDGGMILSNDKKLVSRIKCLRVQGKNSKYLSNELGFNSRLSEMQAAILRVKLKYLNEWIIGRRRVAQTYNRLFKEYKLADQVKLPAEKAEDVFHVYDQYVIRTKKRDQLQKKLRKKGVDTGLYYPLILHLQKCYKNLGYNKGDFPIAEQVCREVLALPIDPALKESQIKYVVESFLIKKHDKKLIILKNQELSLKKQLLTKIEKKQALVGVIGLGYVGLPLAVEIAKAGYKTIGFDIQASKVEKVNRGENYIKDIIPRELENVVKNKYLSATVNFSFIKEVDCITICVPTPLDKYYQPDTSYLIKTAENIVTYFKPGLLIIIESTTYPGTTEEIIKPIFEETGLKAGKDFFLAFSPERIDPGNKKYNVNNTPKVVGGINSDSTELAIKFYENILKSKIYKVSSSAVAEMEKILENTYRYINIALVNELAILAREMNINIWEVIEAANTKPYGFTAFYPGIGVGGHCIPVDPFYLSWKAKEYNFRTKLIELAGDINIRMPYYILERIIDILNKIGQHLKGAKILQLGVAYKQDIDDLRHSPAIELFKLLQQKQVVVKYNDPYIPEFHIGRQRFQSVFLNGNVLKEADLVIITTQHSCYDYSFIQKQAKYIFDTKNALRDINERQNIEVL